jgi:hypothetical protein
MQEEFSRTPSITWATTERFVSVERTPEKVVILAPLALDMTAQQTISKAEPLLSVAERRSFREAFGL